MLQYILEKLKHNEFPKKNDTKMTHIVCRVSYRGVNAEDQETYLVRVANEDDPTQQVCVVNTSYCIGRYFSEEERQAICKTLRFYEDELMEAYVTDNYIVLPLVPVTPSFPLYGSAVIKEDENYEN